MENITQNRDFGSEVEYALPEDEERLAGVIVIEERELEKNSHKNIFDLLSSKNILNTSPSSDKSSQYIDTRGYGLENGSQNILFILDGVKLQNIDMSRNELTNIRLSDVKKITVQKGSGVAKHGSGGNGAIINIETKNGKNPTLYNEIGSNGSKKISFGGGIARDTFMLDIFGGFQDLSSGIKSNNQDDFAKNSTLSLTHRYFLKSGDISTKIFSDNSEIAYIDPMSKNDFEEDPTQDGDPTQDASSKDTKKGGVVGINYDLSESIRSKTTLSKTTRKLLYKSTWWNNSSRYESNSINELLSFGDYSLGIEKSDAFRENGGNRFEKNQNSIFGDIIKSYGGFELYLGGRFEKTEFKYKNGFELKDNEKGGIFEAKISKDLLGFKHYLSYQNSKVTPNVDTFFTYDFITWAYNFNGFIKPQKSDTFGYGASGNLGGFDTSFDAYYIALKDEIYFNSYSQNNTNLDKTQKIGFDIGLEREFTKKLIGNLGYSFVDATILEDDYNLSDKKTPGVSPHKISLGIDYKIEENLNLNTEAIYKSSYFALSDFKNELGKIGEAYSVINTRLDYQLNDARFFIGIKNIFDKKNSLAIYNDKSWAGFTNLDWYYPIDFQREFYAGSEIRF